MDNQTQDYITLRSIVERFEEVAMIISNDEVKAIIKEELRKQIRKQIEFGEIINEWIETWSEDEDNCDFVMNYIRDSIKNKFK